jgi:arylsulfatase A-like enzyme
MKKIKSIIKLTLFIAAVALISWSKKEEKKPNIVMIYVDDWAWYGSPVAMDENIKNSFMSVLEMPNVESLAKDGMKFRNAFTSPMCAPARSCVQTGQSSIRSGFTVYQGRVKDDYYDSSKLYKDFPLTPNVSFVGLNKKTKIIPEVLKPLGYTSAHLGKWHLRSDPGEHGYDVNDGDMDNKPGNTLKKGKNGFQARRLPNDLSDPKLMFSITDRGVDFMEKQVKKGNPFYLQLSHFAMHAGSECLPATREKYLKKPEVQAWYKKNNKDPKTIHRKQDPAVWLGMADDLDGRIGVLLNKIKELGIEDNTYVVLVADNGYRHEELLIDADAKQPLHARKWWAWDGGLRVPMIVRGPGIKENSTFMGNVINYDFLPTFVDWAGGDSKNLKDIDGVSLAPYMEGKTPKKDFLNRYLYFHYPHYRTSVPHSAIISGESKVLHFYETPEIKMLFDRTNDFGEVNNIAKEDPKKHKELYDEMMRYFVEFDAKFPKVNPTYNAEKYEKDRMTKYRIKWGAFEGKRTLDEDEL